MESKKCRKCLEIKPVGDFYKHSHMADGLLNKCKECTKADVRKNRSENISYYRAYDLIRAKRPERAAAVSKVASEWRKTDKRRMRCHNMVSRAVRAGKLTPKPCEVCGSEKSIHAHHDSYDRPLDVIWLCAVHHKARHAELDAAGVSP